MKHTTKLKCRDLILVFMVLLFTAFTSQAGAKTATTGKITGTIVDNDLGEGLIGANVFLESTTLGAATDLDGNYQILHVPAGT